MPGPIEMAAAGVLKRIRQDGEGRAKELQKALTHLEQSLFDKDLTVGGFSEACNVRESALHRLFRTELDHSPWSYIRNRRMEVAMHLLRVSDMEVWQVSDAVGYRSVTSFCKLFKKWVGLGPTDYREQQQYERIKEDRGRSREFREKLSRGELSAEDAQWTVGHLTMLYSLEQPPPPQVCDHMFDEELRAEVLWRKLQNRPFEDQKNIVRFQFGFRTSALFHLLLEKSREERGACGAKRSVEYAELALYSLEGSADALGSDLTNLRTRGLAWLGNARRLNFDFHAAEVAFNDAEAVWRIPRATKDSGALADLLALKAMLRYFQRCFEEALDLNNRALVLLRKQIEPELLAQALIARSAMKGSAGQPQDGFNDLEEALQILEGRDLPELQLVGLTNLAFLHAFSGSIEKSEELVIRAKALSTRCPVLKLVFHVQWLEGLLARSRGDLASAELLLSHAQNGYFSIGEIDYEAIVSLDLAILCAEVGKTNGIAQLLAKSVPTLEAFKARREAIEALQLIQDTLSQNTISLQRIKEVRVHLEILRRDPWFGSERKPLG
ncbi:MAG: helix-turn-helix transcriptional regulator [bacterium]|nr:helix-turn-helix transcriptional regulator [bacterium]